MKRFNVLFFLVIGLSLFILSSFVLAIDLSSLPNPPSVPDFPADGIDEDNTYEAWLENLPRSSQEYVEEAYDLYENFYVNTPDETIDVFKMLNCYEHLKVLAAHKIIQYSSTMGYTLEQEDALITEIEDEFEKKIRLVIEENEKEGIDDSIEQHDNIVTVDNGTYCNDFNVALKYRSTIVQGKNVTFIKIYDDSNLTSPISSPISSPTPSPALNFTLNNSSSSAIPEFPSETPTGEDGVDLDSDSDDPNDSDDTSLDVDEESYDNSSSQDEGSMLASGDDNREEEGYSADYKDPNVEEPAYIDDSAENGSSSSFLIIIIFVILSVVLVGGGASYFVFVNKSMSFDDMFSFFKPDNIGIDPELQKDFDFIQDDLRHNITESQIRVQLKNNGWNDEQIDTVFKEFYEQRNKTLK